MYKRAIKSEKKNNETLPLTGLIPCSQLNTGPLGTNVDIRFILDTIFLVYRVSTLTHNLLPFPKHSTPNSNHYYFWWQHNRIWLIPDNMQISIWWSISPLGCVTILQVVSRSCGQLIPLSFSNKCLSSNNRHFYNFLSKRNSWQYPHLHIII